MKLLKVWTMNKTVEVPTEWTIETALRALGNPDGDDDEGYQTLEDAELLAEKASDEVTRPRYVDAVEDAMRAVERAAVIGFMDRRPDNEMEALDTALQQLLEEMPDAIVTHYTSDGFRELAAEFGVNSDELEGGADV